MQKEIFFFFLQIGIEDGKFGILAFPIFPTPRISWDSKFWLNSGPFGVKFGKKVSGVSFQSGILWIFDSTGNSPLLTRRSSGASSHDKKEKKKPVGTLF